MNPPVRQPPPHDREAVLLDAALGKPASERAIFLDGACHGDPALRARLEARLAAHQAAGSPLTDPGASTSAGTPTLEFSNAPDEGAGQMLGRYKLLEKLGEGGFGTVWAAEQREPVKRRVALKIIKLSMDNKQVVARFEAERQALAMMDHPNIAKVLDAGATDTGRPFFVMELVRGVRITDHCDEANLTTKQRLDLFIKVCHASQHAHQKGIIHRDIKPSNILITEHDGVPVPKVLDLGQRLEMENGLFKHFNVAGLGWSYLEQGHVDEAATLCELALRRKPDGNPPANASSIINLGAVRLAQERYADAEMLLREGLPFVERY